MLMRCGNVRVREASCSPRAELGLTSLLFVVVMVATEAASLAFPRSFLTSQILPSSPESRVLMGVWGNKVPRVYRNGGPVGPWGECQAGQCRGTGASEWESPSWVWG